MANNKELEIGLRAMVEDYHLPGGGRKKLSQLVAGHSAWFDAAERRGMAWRDIIRVLTAAGITGRGGKPLSIGTLSSTVWRKRHDVSDEAGHHRQDRARRPGSIQSVQGSLRDQKRPSAEDTQRAKRTINQQGNDGGKAGGSRPTASKRSNARGGEPNKRDVIAFMDRARSVRRRSEET